MKKLQREQCVLCRTGQVGKDFISGARQFTNPVAKVPSVVFLTFLLSEGNGGKW